LQERIASTRCRRLGIFDILKDGLNGTPVTSIPSGPAELVDTANRSVIIVDFLDFKEAGTGKVIKSPSL
jgi:hypothetical protein